MHSDQALGAVAARWRAADPTGSRAARVIRATFDQLYDGQRTGRYRVDQLTKTEKTHCGSLIEINVRREFADVISDGATLDFTIDGYEVDCKFSLTLGGWMLPPECFEHLLLVCHADDERGEWSLGLVRATTAHRRPSANRDAKTGLNADGRSAIQWIAFKAPLPPNILIRLSPDQLATIMGSRSGQARVNQLFRTVQRVAIPRNTIATVAQQDDFMKRVRDNGGARSALRPEGIVIPGGDLLAHQEVARSLGGPIPAPGECVAFTVVPADIPGVAEVELDGRRWRIAAPGEPVLEPAPLLPGTTRKWAT